MRGPKTKTGRIIAINYLPADISFGNASTSYVLPELPEAGKIALTY
jgi:hypothetical protein